jgi:hypothetical protein
MGLHSHKPEHEAVHTASFRVKVKNEWSLTTMITVCRNSKEIVKKENICLHFRKWRNGNVVTEKARI